MYWTHMVEFLILKRLKLVFRLVNIFFQPKYPPSLTEAHVSMTAKLFLEENYFWLAGEFSHLQPIVKKAEAAVV